ncbi:MAG: hypothetical protein LUO97_04475 [Methanomicrobiales archaeon]|nr:hypothetical protein [Methanomicrobiales archaeon]
MSRRSLSPGTHTPYRYFLLLLLLAAIPLSCAAAPIHAVFGEDIPLGGIAPGSDTVYLFLTGPNLPAGGISLAGGTPVTTGVPASFTRVEVQTDDSWRYTWQTGSTGRILDPGTYTLYAVNEPLSRRDLDDSSYSTRAIIFGAPVETVTISLPETTEFPPPGTMEGGPLVTGMQPPSQPNPPTTIPATSSPGRLGPGSLLPLAAVALVILGLHHHG